MQFPTAKFYEKARSFVSAGANEPYDNETLFQYGGIKDTLDDPNTKRMILNSRQAALFGDLDTPPDNIRRKLEPPFRRLYLEFTEPIIIPPTEPGYTDWCHAFIYRHAEGVCEQTINGEKFEVEIAHCAMLGMSLKDGAKEPQFFYRTWTFSLDLGWSLVRKKTCMAPPDPSELPAKWGDNHIFWANQKLADLTERHIGWWENVCTSYSRLVSWIWAYTMCKSVKILQEPMSRQQRRWHERKNIIPKPWHVITVEPKFQSGSNGDGEGDGSAHGYRYDVIGHLRFNKHRKKDGSIIDTIEWVPDHQRGLANALYIPKTYHVKPGKVIAPDMSKYFTPTDVKKMSTPGEQTV